MNLPLTYTPPRVGSNDGLTGATWAEVERFYESDDPIRRIERASIRVFMEKHRQYLSGRVLDFGCGKQPYRDLVVGSQYIAYEIHDEVTWRCRSVDTIMCNQVLQYIDNVPDLLRAFFSFLRVGGHLVMTYPTNWDEVESSDLWRFTSAGMEQLMEDAGFTVIAHELRARVTIGRFNFPLGYGIVAQK